MCANDSKASMVLACVGMVLAVALCALPSTSAFSIHQSRCVDSSTALHMAKTKKKTKGASSVAKGFGGPVIQSSSSSSKSVETDRSKETRAFYEYMDSLDAQDNLNRCALGFFKLPGTDFKLRGIVATQNIKKGDNIVHIPYELAINLGAEGGDPTIPAINLLKDYCETIPSGGPRAPYYRMLPQYRGDDCLGSTDFFSDAALDALQYPPVKSETLLRRELTQKRFEKVKNDGDIREDLTWIDGTSLTVDHLQWAVWLITSRVLTVQGAETDSQSYRLLIPFLDMANHDRSSPHVLTGRAVPGGELKVVAGTNVKAGEQVNICYGGGQAGNDRFIQDYGFLDTSGRMSDDAYLKVAQYILGKRRSLEGAQVGKLISEEDREEALGSLRQTTMAQDAELIAAGSDDPGLLSAYQFRLGLKKALSKFILIQ